jgi:hypothetical protein
VKSVEAYQSLDGKIYVSKDEARAADEKYKCEKIAAELESLYAAWGKKSDNKGGPMKFVAAQRQEILDLFARHDGMDTV